MDIPTTIETLSFRSKLERDGSHSLLEHVLDGLSVIVIEQFQIQKIPEPERQSEV